MFQKPVYSATTERDKRERDEDADDVCERPLLVRRGAPADVLKDVCPGDEHAVPSTPKNEGERGAAW